MMYNKIKISFNKDIEIKDKRQDFHSIILIKDNIILILLNKTC